MFPRVIQFLSGRTLARGAARSISTFLQCTVLATIAVSVFAGVDISVGESVQGGIVAQVQVGGGEVWAEVWDRSASAASSNSQYTGNTAGTPPVTQSDKDDIWKTILSLLNGLTNVVFSLLTPLLMLAGWLLTPDWVFGEVFGLRPVLHDLWVLVSNIVYVVFAFLLVVMAFMNIFAGEKNTWAIKAKLPKLIVGVISVPFTWFFVSGIVSISSVLTASAIQMAGDLKPTGPEIKITMPNKCTLDFESAPIGGTNKNSGKFSSCEPGVEKPLSELLKSKDAYGIVSYYAYGVFQIQDIKKITEGHLSSVKSVLDLSVGVLIAVLVFIILFLIIAALVVALLSRAFYFWAIAIFSPLLSLRYFFDGKLGGFGDKWLTIGNVIGLAMVPVYVATALSLGLVFISAAQSTNFSSGKSEYYQIKKGEAQNDQIITVLGTEFTIKGKPVGTAVASDALSLGGGTIGSLLIQVAALCILWFAVMTALKGSEITKEAAEPISQFGNEIGGLLKKLPQYAPIIPTGHGKASLNNLSSFGSGIKNAVTTRGNSEANDAGGRLAAAMGFAGDKITTAMNQAANKFNPSTLTPQAAGDSINAITKASGVKTVDEFVRMTSASKNVIAGHVENLTGAITDKTKREEIAKMLRTGNAADITKAYAELDHLLANSVGGSGRDVENSQSSVNTYFAGLQNSAAANSSSSNNTGPIQVSINSTLTSSIDVPIKDSKIDNSKDISGPLASLKSQIELPANAANKTTIRKDLIEKLEAKGVNVTTDKVAVNKILSSLGLDLIQ